jgi:signal transduction histidine kinase
LFAIRAQDFGRVASEIHRFVSFVTTLRYQQSGRQGPVNAGEKKRTIVLQQSDPASAADASPQADENGTSSINSAPTLASWQLIVKHQAGSLEAAVAVARRRNLVIGSSILGVLGASMGLLLLATRRAQRLAQQQMEFVATVSHELRTPLAVIRSAAENLADGVVENESQVRKYGELVRGEGRRLTDMVEQILEFSGIESGERRLNPMPIAIGPLVRDLANAAASLARDAGVELEQHLPEDLPPVLGEEGALRRAFQNLLGNAIKYGAGGGTIRIDARRDGSEVLVTVADRGIGIDPAEHERIFDPFYRAAAVVEAQIQGAGLGLSLVKRIVEAHGGTIAVTSSPGAGAAFTVRLPIADSGSARRASGVARSTAGPPVRSGANAPRYS